MKLLVLDGESVVEICNYDPDVARRIGLTAICLTFHHDIILISLTHDPFVDNIVFDEQD